MAFVDQRIDRRWRRHDQVKRLAIADLLDEDRAESGYDDELVTRGALELGARLL